MYVLLNNAHALNFEMSWLDELLRIHAGKINEEN